MAAAHDFQLIPAVDALGNPSGDDLLIRNGDFVIGASDEQHIQDIINSNPGEWKQFPSIGVGILKFLGGESTDQQEITRLVMVNLQSDGYQVDPSSITYTTDNMVATVDAQR